MRGWTLLLLFAGALALIGCSQAPVPTTTPTRIVILATPEPSATATSVPTAAPTTAPTLVPTAALSATPSRSATPLPTATRTQVALPGTMKVKIFLIAINDNGKAGKKIGCDDSVVPVERTLPATAGVLTAALKDLLALREQYYGQSGLYNSLYQSKLTLDGVSITNGKANIALTGSLKLGGTCDSPRVAAQIQETALQFPTVQQVAVTLNGVALDKALSQK